MCSVNSEHRSLFFIAKIQLTIFLIPHSTPRIPLITSSLLLTPTLEKIPPPLPNEKPWEVFHHTLNSANGTGLGGLAGAPLHPLALGNVFTIKGMLFQYSELEHVQIIGVGGAEDAEGYQRMRAVGAAAVGVGTALGRKGVKVFEEIAQVLEQDAQTK
ncbi:hypothetical protein P154DRAFT_539460 [Amniculicola lignicola CBS 123094]|uniref:Dihydroorotate dehydrogenase catalytic domain-containing protein n=1 Tax=Amniculicola lignicola CBS 123094 TaxID=1392246 RepID=A0A6A5W664_9PLEO|nr:hypothetical protein P154DRAFT_539460 [Amniculicola lignicola CBS 123094]